VYVNLITEKQNKGLFVFDTVFIRTIIWLTLSGSPLSGEPDRVSQMTVFIRTIIWLTLSGSPDNGPDKDSIENKMPFILYIQVFIIRLS
jgi:hypothetical protein